MDLVTARNIKKNYTEKNLLTDVNLIIHDKDKIGLVGVNGSGKSTLLKIIAGVEEPESGEITYSTDIKIGYLPQKPEYEPENTAYEQLLVYMNNSCEEYEARSVLNRLHIPDMNMKMKYLSGGQKKRVALAACIMNDNNLLILDEPTNHMDSDIIEWLEDYLDEFKGAVLMITHDRYFLERVTDHICEIDKGKLVSYEGNYDYYLEAKAARLSMEIASERKRASIYRKELKWIHWSAPARTTKAKNRIERFKRLEESKQNFENPKLEMINVNSRLGKKIIEINQVSKSYEDKVLISDFSYILLRDDRVGIIGPNGSGKTTLMKILAGLIPPTSGAVDIGETVRIGYFSQEPMELDLNQRLIKYAEDIVNNVKTKDRYVSASIMLERFLFPANMHSTYIGKLSGGEKRRLELLTILLQAPNVLLLDEPTNDLDIDTLTILEDYIDEFPGAVILVSHDRYFLDRLAKKCIVFEDNGVLSQYPGGYSDYMNRLDEIKSNKPDKKADIVSDKPKESYKKSKLKFTYNEQKEFETIEDTIATIEEEIALVENLINENSGDYTKLMELTKKKEELDNLLNEKMDRWEYLNNLDSQIKKQKDNI